MDTQYKDMLNIRKWTKDFFPSVENLPISFIYNGRKINGIPDNWATKIERRRIDANIIQTDYEGTDPETGLSLRVECIEYTNYPVVEWTGWLENKSDAPTPIISDILALDNKFEGKLPVLTHCNGDTNGKDQYTQTETNLGSDDICFAPEDGRPCDHAFPYFRLKFIDCGFTMAIGWPAQWRALFKASENSVQIEAGQEKTNLRLMPGEKIRTPKITLLAWDGDETRGINLWRSWYRTHILPKTKGGVLKQKYALSCNGGGYEFVDATEENQLRFLDLAHKRDLPFNVWWIDAGWYNCVGNWELLPVWWTEEAKALGKSNRYDKHWWFTGTWEPDPERFPNGLKPVSDRAAEYGADLLLWFEPERVMKESGLYREHPDWLLSLKSEPKKSHGAYRLENNMLLNLGNPECRQWLTEHISKLITDNGIKIYRQDFNFPPLQYWRDNDAPDRYGMNENLYTQGFLQFWDELLIRHPDLWIDSCSSGGRRNDLETMRRAVPLTASDYGGANNRLKTNVHRTLSEWIPFYMGINACDDGASSRFTHHCSMAPMTHLAVDILNDDFDYGFCRSMLEICRRASEYIINGDCYYYTNYTDCIVRQYDDAKSNSGFIQCINHNQSEDAHINIQPYALRDNITYIFENPETGISYEKNSIDINRHGFAANLSPRDACIWFYTHKMFSS